MNLPLLLGIVLIFLVGIAFLSYLGYRSTRSSADYLVAGRSTHPFVMAMSYGAAFISTSAIVGFGGVAGLFGMGLLWLPLCNIVIGILIAFIFFGKRTRRMGKNLDACTFPEFLGKRYRSPRIKMLAAAIIFCTIPLYSAVVLIGGARFIEESFRLNYNAALLIFAVFVAVYVLLGGLKGVMYVDAMLGSIMLLGMSLMLVFTYWKLGGVVTAHQRLTDLAPLVPAKLAALGHQGWTAMPVFNSQWWWVLVSTLILGVGIGVLAQPQLAVRFMTVRSNRELNRAVLVGSIFILMTAGIAYIVGALSNVYFHEKVGKIALAAAGGNPDLIIPMYINAALPRWFVYLFLVTLLAAAMSTLSALYHVTGTSIGHDFYRTMFRSGRNTMTINRIGLLTGIAISLVLGYVLPGGIIARGTAIFFGICAGTFLPAYAAGIFWKGATRSGAVASIIGGFAASAFGLFFLHVKESEPLGICRLLSGKSCLIETFPWPFVDPILYSLPVATLLLVAVSLCTRKLGERHLDKCFHGFRKSSDGRESA